MPLGKSSSVQSLSRVRLFATPWIAACQASLSITISRSSLTLTSIESVMPSRVECITNGTRKNEATGPKQKWCSVLAVPGDESKIWCYKEQHCIGTWNVRSMNQNKLDTVKQETARLNINIFRNQRTKWMGMDKFNSDDHYCGQESLRRNGVALKDLWTTITKSAINILFSEILLHIFSLFLNGIVWLFYCSLPFLFSLPSL